jgi:hypothetical protein
MEEESREGWVPINAEAAEAFLRHILDGGSETDEDTIPRPVNTTPLFPLRDIWPEVVDGLAVLLAQTGEAALAKAVRELDVYERSGHSRGNHRNVVFWSADPTCVDTDDLPALNSGVGRDMEPTILDVVDEEMACIEIVGDTESLPASSSGYLTAPYTTILDVVDEEITCIEILCDAESRRRLLAALPDES